MFSIIIPNYNIVYYREADGKQVERLAKNVEVHKYTKPIKCDRFFCSYGYNIEAGGNSARGYHLSEKTRKKMSKSRTGKNNWLYGKHISDDVKIKMSIAHIGKCDIEAVRKGAKKRMGANAYNSRKVIQCDKKGNMIKIYGSMADASRTTNTRTQDIYNCCKGRQKTANSFIWKYYD